MSAATSAVSGEANSTFAPQSSTMWLASSAVRCQLTGVQYVPRRCAPQATSKYSSRLAMSTATWSPGPPPSPASSRDTRQLPESSSAKVTARLPSAMITAGLSGCLAASSERCIWARAGRSEQLEDGGVGLAAALAHGLQAVPGAGGPHVVHERRHDPGAAAAEGVAEGDRAAVRVQPGRVGAGLRQPREGNRGEGLVDLEHPDVIDGQAAALEREGSGGDRAGQHDHRVVADDHRGVDPRDRRQAELGRLLAGGDQQGGRAVGYLRAVGRGDRAVLPEGGLELGELVQRAASPDALVSRDGGAVGGGDGGDLDGEPSLVLGDGGLRVRAEAELVELAAVEAPAVNDHLRADPLVRPLAGIALKEAGAERYLAGGRHAHRHPAH